tara:strand:+ start:12809 stop:13588 length:780 start_codon:yes stop_codon:yes gene_type:complete
MKPLGSTSRNQWHVSHGKVDMVRADLPSRPVELLIEPRSLKIDLARSAVLVIDMQNDFCHPDGWLASIGVDVTPTRAPIEPLSQCLPRLREQGVPIIWVNWGNRPDLLNISPSLMSVYDPNGEGVGLGAPLPSNGAPILEAGSWAAATVDELRPVAGDVQVDKYRMSGFWETPLDSILRNLNVQTLFFAGVNLDQCVMCTLQDANFRGYDCILLEDCAATTSPSFCTEATLYNIRQCFGMVAHSLVLTNAMAALPTESM